MGIILLLKINIGWWCHRSATNVQSIISFFIQETNIKGDTKKTTRTNVLSWSIKLLHTYTTTHLSTNRSVKVWNPKFKKAVICYVSSWYIQEAKHTTLVLNTLLQAYTTQITFSCMSLTWRHNLAVGMTYVAIEEIRIWAKAQWPWQPPQLVIHTYKHTLLSQYIHTHTNTRMSSHSMVYVGLVAARLQSMSVTLFMLSHMIISVLLSPVESLSPK